MAIIRPNSKLMGTKPELDSEAISSFNCNIASGIILESVSLFKEENKNNKLSKPDKIWFNGLTLFRNYVECWLGPTTSKINILKDNTGIKNSIDLFLLDTEYLLNACAHSNLEPIIYIPDYSYLEKKWPLWKSADKLSAIKYHIYLVWLKAIKPLINTYPGAATRTTFRLPKIKNAYLVTHLAQDLLNFVDRKDVFLAESHTGEIKDKTLWYTKYKKYSNKEMSIFPFNEFLLRILGDNWFLGSEKPSFKKWLYNIALRYKWNPYTTTQRIMLTMIQKDPILGKKLKTNFKKIY